MIHLDTHVIVWLWSRRSRLSQEAMRRMDRGPCAVSPIVLLELGFLFELGRINQGPDAVVANLSTRLDLAIVDCPVSELCSIARRFTWTRDPFDRLIVAHAVVDGARLVTADQTILANFDDAVW